RPPASVAVVTRDRHCDQASDRRHGDASPHLRALEPVEGGAVQTGALGRARLAVVPAALRRGLQLPVRIDVEAADDR
ncbi:hypothetical protein PybrP1_000209, partial [[Pythium] brassicae (nom. inval.)]